jgi:hypothetical protein
MKTCFPFLALAVIVTACLALAADDAKTFKPDDEGYIHNWLILEPVKLTEDIANHDEAQEKPVFAKDWVMADHRPRAGDKLKANDKEYAWTAQKSTDAIVDFTQAFADKDHDQCLFLGVAYIQSDKELENVKLSIGSDDSSVWRVNGKEVIRVYAGRDCEKDTDKSQPLTLKKGTNVLEFAVTQGDGPTAAVARFLDKDDKPVKDLTITLTPPAPPQQ